MLITCKAVGRRKALLEDWSVPVPSKSFGNGAFNPFDGNEDGGGLTLRDLIAAIVSDEVDQFHARQNKRQFIRVLTADDINAACTAGKIEMGGSEIPPQVVDKDEAIAIALTAFEDGLFLVVVDEVPIRHLESQVYLTDDSRVTFLRLTFLSGA